MSFVDAIKSAPVYVVGYAYRHSRRQFWPALYVLLYAGLYGAGIGVAFWLISAITPLSLSVKWSALGGLAAIIATGELVRGHVRLWMGTPAEKWSAAASLAGGAAGGLALSVLAFPNQSAPAWYEPLFSVGFGAVAFFALGWLIQYQAKQ